MHFFHKSTVPGFSIYCCRFLNPAMANKNRIQPPSKIVHFFNTPPDLTEETVNRVFIERGIEAPTTIKLFPLKSERSSSGLIEFSSVGIAVAAIMECNHTALENSSKYLYRAYDHKTRISLVQFLHEIAVVRIFMRLWYFARGRRWLYRFLIRFWI